jgi:Tol biopolymer transport system component/thiol-disulfide isomerase/thioredoxin
MVNFLKSATRLDVPASEVSGMDLEHLAGSRSLRSLSVPDTTIKDEDLVHLKDVVSLEGLFLARTQITDAGLANLKDLTALRALCVEDNQVGDAGLIFLQNLHSLEYLCLANTKVTDAGLTHLGGLASLRDLRLAGAQVTKTGANELRRLLPNCRIFGPDGSSVYAPTQAPAGERLPERMQLVASGSKASWSPDGARMVFGKPKQKGLQILEVATDQTTDLTSSGKDPAWSPDGRFIAYVQGSEASEETWLIESTGGEPRKLMDGGFPSWSADGKTLYVHSRSENKILAIAIDKPQAKPEVFLDGPGAWFPSISPDGTRIALGRKNALVIMNRSGQAVMAWPTPGQGGLLPAWSPDGKQVAFGGFDNQPFGVWILDVKAKEAVQVADGPYTMPVWSPDGANLAFDLRSEGIREIWMIQTAEIQGPRLTAAEAARLRPPLPAPPIAQPGPSGMTPEESPLIGKPAPSFTLQDLSGKQVSVSDFRGKVVLLDFWATWCPPCVKAVPHLEALYTKYRDEGLVIIGLNDEADHTKVSQFAKDQISYTVLLDANKQFGEYGIQGIPTLFYIDRKGNVRYREIGFSEGKESEIETRIKELLSSEPNEKLPME